MRTLFIVEMELVSGAGAAADAATVGVLWGEPSGCRMPRAPEEWARLLQEWRVLVQQQAQAWGRLVH